MKLTPKEKSIVAHYIHSDPSFWGAIKDYWPMILPIILIGGYGFISQDIIALFLAFLALLGFIFWFFNQSGKSGLNLKSALEKYESEVGAIDK